MAEEWKKKCDDRQKELKNLTSDELTKVWRTAQNHGDAVKQIKDDAAIEEILNKEFPQRTGRK